MLFSRAFLNYISLYDKCIANYELERKRKQALMLYFNASSEYLTGRIEKNNDRSHLG
jgi:hypothetical protein